MDALDSIFRPDAIPLGPKEWLILPKPGYGEASRMALTDLTSVKCGALSLHTDGGEAFHVRGVSKQQIVTVFAVLRDYNLRQ